MQHFPLISFGKPQILTGYPNSSRYKNARQDNGLPSPTIRICDSKISSVRLSHSKWDRRCSSASLRCRCCRTSRCLSWSFCPHRSPNWWTPPSCQIARFDQSCRTTRSQLRSTLSKASSVCNWTFPRRRFTFSPKAFSVQRFKINVHTYRV